MKNKIFPLTFMWLLWVCLLPALVFSQQKVKEKDLAPRFQEFLKLTKYIILEREEDVFMQLTSDRDRDIFIEAFWRQRDPTPGTPDNEYKIEHIRRFNYANRILKRGAVRPGWMTDMGRIYIILGEPTSKEYFETSMGIYPVQVWYYYGDSSRGLPTHFAIVFFKRSGAGEFRLYDHVSDGPTALLVEGKQMDPVDFEAMYEKIRELAPTLSLVSHSMIPGDIPFHYQPEPINNIYMANVFDAPKKDVNPSYATHFLDLIGVVSSDYMTNYVESDSQVELLRDPILGIDFLHFSIVPQSVSIDYYEPNDQYFCNFTLSASIRIDDDNIVFQYTKEFPFYFAPDELQRIQENGIAIEDSFPIVNGQYKFIVLLQNSVGKEFCHLEKDISIPPKTGLPHIAGLLLGYKTQSFERNLHIPYKLLDRKLIVDPGNTFGHGDQITVFVNLTNVSRELWDKGEVHFEIQGQKLNNPQQKSFKMKLLNNPFKEVMIMEYTFPALDLTPDYYEMTASLYDETGAKFDSRTQQLIISPEAAVAHPISHSKAFSLANSFYYFYALAKQYEKIKDWENAEIHYARAYQSNPNFKPGLKDYANYLFIVKKYEQILELVDDIKNDENLSFEFFLLQGKALMGMERYQEAIQSFQKGNEIYDSDTGLLNSLGLCYYRIGEFQNALDVFTASLKLNSGQQEIKDLVSEIQKK